MIPNKKHRTPLRSGSSSTGTFLNYLVPPIGAITKPPSLSPDRIPRVEVGDSQIPNENELHEEIRTEELQRHPDAHGDEEDIKRLARVAGDLHRLLSGKRPR